MHVLLSLFYWSNWKGSYFDKICSLFPSSSSSSLYGMYHQHGLHRIAHVWTFVHVHALQWVREISPIYFVDDLSSYICLNIKMKIHRAKVKYNRLLCKKKRRKTKEGMRGREEKRFTTEHLHSMQSKLLNKYQRKEIKNWNVKFTMVNIAICDTAAWTMKFYLDIEIFKMIHLPLPNKKKVALKSNNFLFLVSLVAITQFRYMIFNFINETRPKLKRSPLASNRRFPFLVCLRGGGVVLTTATAMI